MEEPIVRQALGRVAAIGDLYDARNEGFCLVNVFKSALPPSAIQTTDNQFVDSCYTLSSNLSEKLKSLEIAGQLKASILSNICHLEGSAKYLSDEKTSEKAVRAHMIYNVKTVNDRLNILSEDLKAIINTDAVRYEKATHVVVQINWGANAFLSIEHKNTDNKSQKEIQGNLDVMLTKLGCGLSGKLTGAINTTDLKASEECSFQIFADLLPSETELSQALEDYLNLMKQMPLLLKKSNNGKGKPLSYAMLPISVLQKHTGVEALTDHLMRDIEEHTIMEIVNLFDEMSTVKQKVNDLYFDIEKHVRSTGQSELDRIALIRNKLAFGESKMRSRLAKVIVQYRSKEVEADALQNLMADYKKDKYSAANVRTQLNQFNSISKKLAFVNTLKSKGVHYFGENESLDNLFLKFQARNVYILQYNLKAATADDDLWVANRRIFYRLIEESGGDNGPVCVFTESSKDDQEKLLSEKISISRYRNGVCLSKDFASDSEKLAKLSLAKSSSFAKQPESKPDLTAKFETICPGSFAIICRNVKRKWQCFDCNQFFEYDFNDNVYCSCGGFPVKSLKFKCNDENHGLKFVQFKKNDDLQGMLNAFKPPKTINILLLGEKGVGKSTWINAFANYLTFSTLKDAAKSELNCPIPTAVDNNCNGIIGAIGSATRRPNSYVFDANNTCIRLIDTPGIGDIRRNENYEKMFDKILSYLTKYEQIHGICLVLQPEVNIGSHDFIRDVLSRLHKECGKIIQVVLTNARSTNYQPGDALSSLKRLLSDNKDTVNKDVDRLLERDNVFCIDNESIRFLTASKSGIITDETERENCSKSWTKSVLETKRLISHIFTLEGRPIHKLISLQLNRLNLLACQEVLDDIETSIQENVILANIKKKEIAQMRVFVDRLKEDLTVDVIDLENKDLKRPRVVCTSPKCTEVFSVGEEKKTHYKQICHEVNRLRNVKINVCPNDRMVKSSIMNKDGSCKKCECRWESHMHINYEQEKVTKQEENIEAKKLLEDNVEILRLMKLFYKAIDARIDQLVYEKIKIEKKAKTFRKFLKENTIIQNDNENIFEQKCDILDKPFDK